MSNSFKEGSSLATLKILLYLVAFLVVAALVSTTQGNKTEPCSSFKNDALSDIPARCITSQGGFKDE